MISRADGSIMFRRTIASTLMIDRPRTPALFMNGYSWPVWGWQRTRLSNGPSLAEMDRDGLILAHTTINPGSVGPGTMERLQPALEAAIADLRRQSGDPIFDTADTWMRSLATRPVTPRDVRLLTALIADRRTTDFTGIWEATRALGARAVLLRTPILRRLYTEDVDPGVGKPLSSQLPMLAQLAPPSTADLRLEEAILADPNKRLAANGLIVQQADRGRSAGPQLLRIIREHAARWSSGQTPSRAAEIVPIDAARVALCRIGQSPSTVEGIREIMRERILPPNMAASRGWLLMRARLGEPVQALAGGRDAELLTAKLANFDVDRDCRPEWS